MIDILLLDEIVTKAIPFEQADCKRIKAKKEWRREQMKEQILAWHKKCLNGGTLQSLGLTIEQIEEARKLYPGWFPKFNNI